MKATYKSICFLLVFFFFLMKFLLLCRVKGFCSWTVLNRLQASPASKHSDSNTRFFIISFPFFDDKSSVKCRPNVLCNLHFFLRLDLAVYPAQRCASRDPNS